MSGMEQEDFVFLEALNQRGTVFLARQRSSGRILVARQVPGGQTEIFETLRAMSPKHVPTVRAIEARQDGTAFVYEDYIQGVTLRQRMEEGPPLTREDAVWLGRQLCQALAPLHRENIVHRDIKPENIVLGADSQVYLIDFGIARFEKAGRSADTTLLGTHGYAAPEQFGFCQSDARADIYSRGGAESGGDRCVPQCGAGRRPAGGGHCQVHESRPAATLFQRAGTGRRAGGIAVQAGRAAAARRPDRLPLPAVPCAGLSVGVRPEGAGSGGGGVLVLCVCGGRVFHRRRRPGGMSDRDRGAGDPGGELCAGV